MSSETSTPATHALILLADIYTDRVLLKRKKKHHPSGWTHCLYGCTVPQGADPRVAVADAFKEETNVSVDIWSMREFNRSQTVNGVMVAYVVETSNMPNDEMFPEVGGRDHPRIVSASDTGDAELSVGASWLIPLALDRRVVESTSVLKLDTMMGE